MQTYLHAALGFAGNLLTSEEANRVRDHEDVENSKEGSISARFVPYTEDYDGPNWGTVVLLDLGRVGHKGKLLTPQDIQTLTKQHGTISKEAGGKFWTRFQKLVSSDLPIEWN
jgi:hypothetical protein